MTNFESVEKAFDDIWFGGIGASSLRHHAASSSDLQNSNPERVTDTLHASPSAPNLRQRSTLKTGHLRRRAGDLGATEKPHRGHVRRASTSSIDLGGNGIVNAPSEAQNPLNDTFGAAQAPPPPSQALGRPPRPDAPSRASARSILKQQTTKDYAERRKAWRARLEATMAAPRLYTATVPVPPSARATGSRAASVQSTPSGSPKPPYSLLEGKDTDTSDHPTVPAVWVGHSSDHAPQDFSILDDDALRRFLQQAGSMSPPKSSPTTPSLLSIEAMSHEELVATARSVKGAWEVERVVVGCSLPEQILRVKKSECTDPVLLKAAWKKLALQIHPDRSKVELASVAVAIAKDAFDILAWRAEQYQAAGGASNKTENGGTSNSMAKAPPGPLSTPSEIAAAGGTNNTGPQPPMKVRVKLKVKQVDSTAKPTSSAS
jgi:hypothetical protein